jgi:hypothetical protein
VVQEHRELLVPHPVQRLAGVPALGGDELLPPLVQGLGEADFPAASTFTVGPLQEWADLVPWARSQYVPAGSRVTKVRDAAALSLFSATKPVRPRLNETRFCPSSHQLPHERS